LSCVGGGDRARMVYKNVRSADGLFEDVATQSIVA
jgi:hypothetical protein